VLQKLKELFLGNNWLPSASLKEFIYLKALVLLDLSNNKLSADFEKWTAVFQSNNMKQLHTISVRGNQQLEPKM